MQPVIMQALESQTNNDRACPSVSFFSIQNDTRWYQAFKSAVFSSLTLMMINKEAYKVKTMDKSWFEECVTTVGQFEIEIQEAGAYF